MAINSSLFHMLVFADESGADQCNGTWHLSRGVVQVYRFCIRMLHLPVISVTIIFFRPEECSCRGQSTRINDVGK